MKGDVNMIASKKDLFLKIYDELIENGIIQENNSNFITIIVRF